MSAASSAMSMHIMNGRLHLPAISRIAPMADRSLH